MHQSFKDVNNKKFFFELTVVDRMEWPAIALPGRTMLQRLLKVSALEIETILASLAMFRPLLVITAPDEKKQAEGKMTQIIRFTNLVTVPQKFPSSSWTTTTFF